MATAISELSTLNSVTDTDLLIVSHLSGESYVTRSLSAGNFATKSFVENTYKTYDYISAQLSNDGYATSSQIENQHFALSSDVSSQIDNIQLKYSLISAGTTELEDRAIQHIVLSVAQTQLVLPQLTNGKVSDFGIDITNGYTVSDIPTSATISLSGTIEQDFNIITDENEDFSDMTKFEPDEMAQLYFTQTAFQLDGLPTWKVTKQVVHKYVLPTV